MENLIDIHLHLDGSLPFRTVKKLMKKHGLPEMTNKELCQRLSVSKNCHDLNEYLEKFAFLLTLMQTKSDLERIVFDLLQDLREQHFIYVEIRFAPQLHTQKNLTQEDAVKACISGCHDFLDWQKSLSDNRPDLHANFILCCMRMKNNHAENLETVTVAKKLLSSGVVGIDLAGAEAPELEINNFKDVFIKAKSLGIPYTIHSGEAMGPESIKQALNLGAKRIGHGIRCTEDLKLVQKLAHENITLECCATSNLNTKIFNQLDHYPVRRLLHKGVNVTLNTDNMTVSNTSLAHEYHELEIKTGLLPNEEKEMLLNSVNACFASNKEKQRLLKIIK